MASAEAINEFVAEINELRRKQLDKQEDLQREMVKFQDLTEQLQAQQRQVAHAAEEVRRLGVQIKAAIEELRAAGPEEPEGDA